MTSSGRRTWFSSSSGVVGKQAAVVGREADGRVALVDLREEIGQVTVVARCGTGEGVAAGRAPGHVVADAFAEAVVVVSGVVDGEQAAVFGVEDEEQAVEKDKGGFTNCRHGLVGLVGQGLEEAGIDAFEDDAREALGDALFVAAARRQCCLNETRQPLLDVVRRRSGERAGGRCGGASWSSAWRRAWRSAS